MAQYDPTWVSRFYDEYGEREWTRWDRSPVEQVKFYVHLHYLQSYLGPEDRILEMGAGAGKFTQELAKISKRIVVADISPVQLRLNRENAERLGFSDSIEDWVECDVCDLRPHFRDGEFGAVVCYGGPLSYVFEERERATAELLRVLAPEGWLFTGVMSLWGTLHHFLPYAFEVSPDVNREIIASGDQGPDKIEVGPHFCHLFRGGELRALLERAGAEVHVLSASDCLSATWAQELEAVEQDPERWAHLLEMELEACREPGCIDMGTHLIAVCRKPG